MNIDLTSLLRLDRINLNSCVASAITVKKSEIVALNTQQMDKGIKSDSSSIGSYKNYNYKQRFTPVDLLKDGDFRRAIDIIPEDNSFVLIDTDSKTPMLTKKYGTEIIGLTSEDMDSTGQILLPEVKNNLEIQLS
jgi:hypothetical protein